MDPYQILGIKPGCSWKEVKNAYKTLAVIVHPDKLNGDARMFDTIHIAYQQIKKQHLNAKTFSDAPKEKINYKQESDIISPHKMKHFTNDKFNTFFEKNKINEDKYAQQGYQNFMSQSLNFQEDLEVAKKQHIFKPKQELVRYKEPEYLNSTSCFDNCQTFGDDEITDFTGGGGTDIMKAYSEPLELIDTATRYKGMDDIKSRRTTENLQATEYELKKMKKMKEKQEKLETLRLNRLEQEAQLISQKYIQLNRRLK